MGKNTWIALCAVVSALGACTQNDIRPTAGLSPTIAPASTAMAEASIIMPPSGYLDYCLRNPAECPSAERTATQPEALTPLRWAELDRVNTMVNASVRYVSDARLYNRSEYWTQPNGRGDCEDFVLAKRKLLLDRGWRAETLLIGVALDLEGLRHAVLIAATDKGDFVLDNQLERVVSWSATGYTWEKRQTAANANIWVALTGDAVPAQRFEPPVPLPALVATLTAQDRDTAATSEGLATASRADQSGIQQIASSTPPQLPLARPHHLVVAEPNLKEVATADPTASGA